MSPRIPSQPSHRAQLYSNINTPGGPSQSNKTPRQNLPAPSESSETAKASQRPDLGDGLSAEERNMIHEQFPPAPETSMRVYGRDRGQQDLQPESLGNQLDIRG